jgi:arginyl-tRNA synthetase
VISKNGFINFFLKDEFVLKSLKEIYSKNFLNYINFGEDKKINVEFVSANPTGPLHVGHCRGAILGDVISNILTFNRHLVTKEYYVNDHGNQIINFTKSVFFRIREILNNEKFPLDNNDLYPGDYLIEIAQNIISDNKQLKFDNFNKIVQELTKLSVAESLKLIKLNLQDLGVIHDNLVNSWTILLKLSNFNCLLSEIIFCAISIK